MSDRLTAMRVFVEVVERGGFTAAAEHLDLSRAMVTRHVSALEQWLGARLLQRTTRRVTLTDAGEHCLRRSQQVLALVAEVEDETRSQDGRLRGQLRLTCSPSFAHAHLAAALVDFLALHPELKVDLNAGDGAVNLVEARVDLALRISADPDPALIGRVLAPCHSWPVASPAYLDLHGRPRYPSELATHRCLGHANVGRHAWRFASGAESVEVQVRAPVTANEATTLLHAALAGGGVALLPRYLVNPLWESGQLERLLPDWDAPVMAVHALYTSRRHQAPAVRALLDFLAERFAQQPW